MTQVQKTNLSIIDKYRIMASKRYTTIDFLIGESLLEDNLMSSIDYNNLIDNYNIIKKDVKDGDILVITNIESISSSKIQVLTTTFLNVEIDLKKEIEYFKNNIDINIKSIQDVIELVTNNMSVLNGKEISSKTINDRLCGSLADAYSNQIENRFISDLKIKKDLSKGIISLNSPNLYVCKIISRNDGGFFVDINGVSAFLPGSLAGANKITDFNSLLNTQLPVMVEDYLRDSDTYVVSHKKYIEYILPKQIEELRSTIGFTKYQGIVTGCMKFGLFIEFNKIFTGLLHFSGMNKNFHYEFKNGQYRAGDEIEFYIKEINDQNRIILCTDQKELSPWDKFKLDYEGKQCSGQVCNITSFGAFVKFDVDGNNFRGLLLFKNMKNETKEKIGGLQLNETYLFKIDQVLEDDKKIFLSM